jgi:hypothetical protein
MWNLIRGLVVVLAMAGFVGQTSARAMPMPQAPMATAAQTPAMMNCAEMQGMSDMAQTPSAKSPTQSPCKGMTADCIGKMGCATVATPPPASFGVSGSVTYQIVTFVDLNQEHEGVVVPRPYHPPKPLA